MTTFRCARFPDGEVPIRTAAGLVVFIDGQAEVDGLALADALRDLPSCFEIFEETPEDWRPLQVRPGRAAPKAAWVAWAVHNGMAEADAEGLTVKQLISQFGG
jgi:hypothetical protein